MTAGDQAIVLYGEFGCGNLGNEASLDAVLSWLRTCPGLDVRSVTREPAAVTQEHQIPSVSMYVDRSRLRCLPDPVRKVYAKLADLIRMPTLLHPGDLVVVPGTGVFEQQLSGPPWGLPLSMFGLALGSRIRRAKLALVGVGASDDTRLSVRWLTRRIVSQASFVTVRDQHSKEGLAAVGVRTAAVGVYADVAFSGVDPDAIDRRPEPPDAGPLRLGLGVINYHDPDDGELGRRTADRYEAELAAFCRYLLERGHHVELLIGDTSDAAVATTIEAAARDAGRRSGGTVRFAGHVAHQSLAAAMFDLDLVIGSRYHNLIFALVAGTPVMSLGYAPKCDHLLSSAGLGDYTLRIADADSAAMIATFERLRESLAAATAMARVYARAAHDSSQKHRDDFLRRCLAPTGVLVEAGS